MRISDYDYHLPDEAIAYHPPKNRGTSRLLVLDKVAGNTTHKHYNELAEHLSEGDVVVLNDTKVIKARILAKNKEGLSRELLLLEEHGRNADHHHRICMYRGKLQVGETLIADKHCIIVEEVRGGGLAVVSSEQDLLAIAEQTGLVPLPPYIKREPTREDTERYQTVFAKHSGSVAAPTASLNFTEQLKDALTSKGVVIAYLTLHVGLGTFLPIRSDDIEDHVMHSEYFEIPHETIQAIRTAKAAGNTVCAIGTTVARTLEYAAKDILEGTTDTITGEADIFIYPGYTFKLVNKLVTNFHAPRSTVLMLAAAFAGWDNLYNAYLTAIDEGYRFLSYGDSMLIE